jgi:hypothetical protein
MISIIINIFQHLKQRLFSKYHDAGSSFIEKLSGSLKIISPLLSLSRNSQKNFARGVHTA